MADTRERYGREAMIRAFVDSIERRGHAVFVYPGRIAPTWDAAQDALRDVDAAERRPDPLTDTWLTGLGEA